MADTLTLVWILVLAVVQPAWCIFYAASYSWRTTPLGPVWLAKGTALAVLWPLLLADQFLDVPDWVWAFIVGPFLVLGTVSWLVVTVRTSRASRVNQPQP